MGGLQPFAGELKAGERGLGNGFGIFLSSLIEQPCFSYMGFAFRMSLSAASMENTQKLELAAFWGMSLCKPVM